MQVGSLARQTMGGETAKVGFVFCSFGSVSSSNFKFVTPHVCFDWEVVDFLCGFAKAHCVYNLHD